MTALTIEQKGCAMAAIDQLVRALAFPEDGDVGYRLAAKQLAAVGTREVALTRIKAVNRQRGDARRARSREVYGHTGASVNLPGALTVEEIVDLVLDLLGTTPRSDGGET